MQLYESYKPSDAAWLGNVPSHWDVQPLRAVTSLKSDKNRPDLPVLSVYREYGVILKDSRDDNHNATSLDTSTYKVVKPGDLVVNKMKAWQGSMGVSSHHGIVSPAYITCTTKADRVRPAYLHYLLRSSPLIGVYNSLSYGVRVGQWDMHYEDFKQIPIPLPPKDEQDRIVAFLDQKIAEIDAAIAKKDRLIELLQEQKKTIRNQVITKGLNLSALQCDSGVPWIGAIPSHWKVCAIKRLFKSMDYGLSESALGDGDFKYLNMGHIKDGKVSTENTGYLASAPDTLLLRKNDILFNRTNSFDLVGKSGIYLSDEKNVTFASYMVRIRVKDEICPSWANSLMNSESYLSFIRTLALRSLNQANLNPTRLGAVSVPVPPKEEQEAIADYLDGMSTQVDISIRSIEKELCGLFEMKQTTIANVVTGKIKV